MELTHARFTVLAAAVAAACFAAQISSAEASYYDTVVEAQPGLLGYYPFTLTSQANDVYNGHTGILQNGATIGGPGSGPPIASDPNSSALVLNNGASGTAYATAGGSNPLTGGVGTSGSIVGWIDLASLPSTNGRIYSIAGESQVGNDLDLQIDPSDNTIRFYTDGGSYTGSSALTASDLGNYLFVAATFTAGVDREIYVNGVLQGTNTPGGHSTDTAPFYQGQSNVFGGRYFDGRLADVALYNTDLSAAQVQSIYAASEVSAVPLPASLPMFGAALLGLAGLGYAMRRARIGSTGADASAG